MVLGPGGPQMLQGIGPAGYYTPAGFAGHPAAAAAYGYTLQPQHVPQQDLGRVGRRDRNRATRWGMGRDHEGARWGALLGRNFTSCKGGLSNHTVSEYPCMRLHACGVLKGTPCMRQAACTSDTPGRIPRATPPDMSA
jgi:hypothetical protein